MLGQGDEQDRAQEKRRQEKRPRKRRREKEKVGRARTREIWGDKERKQSNRDRTEGKGT